MFIEPRESDKGLDCPAWLSIESYRGGTYGPVVELLRSGELDYKHASHLFSFAVLGACARQCEWKLVGKMMDQSERFCFSQLALSYALSFAASDDCLEAVHLLVEKGADVNHRTSHRSSPVFLAAECSSLEMVTYLIDLGAEYRGVVDNDGDDILTHAAVGGKVRTVKWLVSEGLSCSQRDCEGLTPLENVQRDIARLQDVDHRAEVTASLDALCAVEEYLLSLDSSAA